MKFKTYFSSRPRVYTHAGSPIKDEYQLRVVDNKKKLVKTGQSSLYKYIQSHKDSVDLHKILERCAQLDDYSMLNRMPAQFMDTTDMPTNLAEAYAQIQDARNMFERMPLELKEKYDNNYLEFISDIGSSRFESNVRSFLDSIKKPESEVSADES